MILHHGFRWLLRRRGCCLCYERHRCRGQARDLVLREWKGDGVHRLLEWEGVVKVVDEGVLIVEDDEVQRFNHADEDTGRIKVSS